MLLSKWRHHRQVCIISPSTIKFKAPQLAIIPNIERLDKLAPLEHATVESGTPKANIPIAVMREGRIAVGVYGLGNHDLN